jgi:hypothetical protein
VIRDSERLLAQRQAAIAAADKRVADADRIARLQKEDMDRRERDMRGLSRVNDYCRRSEQANDKTCAILLGRDATTGR